MKKLVPTTTIAKAEQANVLDGPVPKAASSALHLYGLQEYMQPFNARSTPF
jgi:hypothetical protein